MLVDVVGGGTGGTGDENEDEDEDKALTYVDAKVDAGTDKEVEVSRRGDDGAVVQPDQGNGICERRGDTFPGASKPTPAPRSKLRLRLRLWLAVRGRFPPPESGSACDRCFELTDSMLVGTLVDAVGESGQGAVRDDANVLEPGMGAGEVDE